MRIYIIGYMCSGKSYFAEQLAAALQYAHKDLDIMLESKVKLSIPDFFQKYDENAFRLIEKEILHDTLKIENTVISTGGGTPCFFDNMDFMLKHGVCIYLDTTVDIIFKRLQKTKTIRPLLAHKSDDELYDFIRKHIKEREDYYNQAQLRINPVTTSIEQTINYLSELNPTKK